MLSCFSCVQLFATLWTKARQFPVSMGFSSQEYWSGLPFPSPGDLSDPEIEPTSPVSPAMQADSLPSQPPRKPQYLRGTSNCDILIISDLKYVLLCLPPK